MTFEELDDALGACHASVSGAEAHGSLCGTLAVRGQWQAAHWIAELIPERGDSDQERAAIELLELVFVETQSTLIRDQMEFMPLLPGDDSPIAQRVEALAAWCTGFLHGLASGGLQEGADLPEVVQEVVRDFVEMTQAVVDPEESEEANEEAYVELQEYLRASAQLVYETLVLDRTGRGDA
jgi:hypothetical protein